MLMPRPSCKVIVTGCDVLIVDAIANQLSGEQGRLGNGTPDSAPAVSNRHSRPLLPTFISAKWFGITLTR
jgi:hypothetical protein